MDYRAPMTRAEFDAIPVDPKYPVDSLWDRVIDGNPHNLYELPPEKLTDGQRLFIALGSFDSQVCNGGITPFFWNRPESVFDVRDGLAELGEAELDALYSRAVDAILDKQTNWHELREEAYRDPKAPDWGPFQQSYDLLDLGWFDTAYFDRWGHDSSGQWVTLGEGLKSPFLRRLAAWVKAHPEEFITG